MTADELRLMAMAMANAECLAMPRRIQNDLEAALFDFAMKAVAEEREACARIAAGMAVERDERGQVEATEKNEFAAECLRECADEIRNQGQNRE